MNRPLRLTPTSANRRTLLVEFVRRYWLDHGASPSFAEIAAALDTSVQRISGIVAECRAAGLLLHTPGDRRGLRLPDPGDNFSISQALLVLRREGWIVFDDARHIAPPAVTFPELMVPPAVSDDAGRGEVRRS